MRYEVNCDDDRCYIVDTDNNEHLGWTKSRYMADFLAEKMNHSVAKKSMQDQEDVV